MKNFSVKCDTKINVHTQSFKLDIFIGPSKMSHRKGSCKLNSESKLL